MFKTKLQKIPCAESKNRIVFPKMMIPVEFDSKYSDLCKYLEKKRDDSYVILFENFEIGSVGTMCKFLEMYKSDEGTSRVLLIGKYRVILRDEPEFNKSTKFFVTNDFRVTETGEDDELSDILIKEVLSLFEKVMVLSKVSREVLVAIQTHKNDYGAVCDLITHAVDIPINKKYKILGELHIPDRIKLILKYLNEYIDILNTAKDIVKETRETMDENNRKYYLRSEMEAIKKKLGEEKEEDDTYEEKIENANLPEEALNEARNEVKRMKRMHPASHEYSVIATYLDWILDLPWNKSTEDVLDIKSARERLDNDHYGLEKPKKRILEYLAIRKLNPESRSPILCFVGSPGVGKTSISKSIAEAMGREFQRMSLGGVRDEAEIRGHRSCIKNAYILSKTGFVNIENSYENSKIKILNEAHEFEDIKYSHREKINKTIKIKTRMGYEIEGSEDHPLLVIEESCNFVFKRLSEFKLGDFIILDRNINENLFNENNISTELARFLGYFCADGNFAINRICISNHNIKIREDIKNIVENLGYKYKYNEGMSYVDSKEFNTMIYNLCDKPEGIKQNNQNNFISYKKYIPKCIMEGEREVHIEFLRGVFNDSFYNRFRNFIEYSSTSPRMAKQVHLLLLSLGIIGRLYKKDTNYNNRRKNNCITLQGKDLKKFVEIIGLYKEEIQDKKFNTNIDIIPFLKEYYISESKRIKKKNNEKWNLYITKLLNSKSMTYDKLLYIIDNIYKYAENDEMYELIYKLSVIYNKNYFYDSVASIEIKNEETYVYDVSTSTHKFWSNGFISHNTYVGAMPGRILQSIKRAGTNNPVIVLDEIDKLGSDHRGDPSSALLEALDPEQNFAFSDHYLRVKFDLSKVIFITTANLLETIPPALRDRMEVINFAGYSQDEKESIAQQFLIPRQLKEHGLKDIKFTKYALDAIINGYTRESGVRNLEREIANIIRGIGCRYVEEGVLKETIGKNDIEEYLEQAKYPNKDDISINVPGVAIGMYYSSAGGGITFYEAVNMSMYGKYPNLTISGNLKDIMKESIVVALNWIRSHKSDICRITDTCNVDNADVHVHVPEGATPKDGPSGGVAIIVALVSLFSGIMPKENTAYTGEITLSGKVLPVGGIKEKVLGAHRAGINHIVMPSWCKNSLDRIPKDIQESIDFYFVDTIDEVLNIAFKGGINVDL